MPTCCLRRLQELRDVARAWPVLTLAWLALGIAPARGAAPETPDTTTEAPVTSPSQARRDDAIIASINQRLQEHWKDAETAPSPAATDSEWCRRVHLDLIGRIPTVEETQRFLKAKGAGKRAELVDRLLASETYADEAARHWTTVWTNLLIGRPTDDERRRMTSRAGMQQYLRRSFLKNKPYDQMVRELVSADGAAQPGEEEYNGAVNFLLDALDEKAVQATAKTARLFLGLQVQCTQCHNHPFNNWKQNQFWELNAFFRQTRALRTFDGAEIVKTRLADEDFAGEGGNPRDAEIYYEERRGTAVLAYPTFVDGTELKDHSGYVDEVNRRDELAKLIVTSPYLAEAIVNRAWSHFLGWGFTKPVDDMGPHNPPSHPELLAELAADFRAHGYDLRKLHRWIALSEAYGLSSATQDQNASDEPTTGETPRFSHFYLRQMTAEQLYESLLAAMRAEKTLGGTPEERERKKQDWLAQFNTAFGTDEGGESSTFNGTIPQSLMMMNGELVRLATSQEEGSFLDRLAQSTEKDAAKLNQLYLAALSRLPSRKEQDLARAAWQAREGDAKAALQDIWWALLNTNEFILNH